MARPMPPEAPVTRTRRPRSSPLACGPLMVCEPARRGRAVRIVWSRPCAVPSSAPTRLRVHTATIVDRFVAECQHSYMSDSGNLLGRAERRGLGHEAADRVREAVFAGVFPPGAVLREVELAADLEVSRGSVREGLARLEQEGLVRSVWHRGTRVIDLSIDDVEDVYTVRAALERVAATTAARRIDAAGLAALKDTVDDMARAVAEGADGPTLLALD